MRRVIADRPSDAEQIQTACRRVSEATLAVEGAEPTPVGVVHLFESQAFLVVPTDGDAVASAADPRGGQRAMVEITDCAPIPLRERVRSLIWLDGHLHTVPVSMQRDLAVEIAADHPNDGLLDLGHGASMLRLQIDTGVIATGSGAAAVAADDLAGAQPDPFWRYESDWIAHLDADHADVIGRLARGLPRELRNGRVRPLSLDRFGIRFRVEGADGDCDVRLPFSRPVADVRELSRALRHMAGCPFLNSLPN